MNHRIHISGNHVTGDVVLTSPTPIIAAAHAILARPGSSPSDTLSVACPDVTVIPQTLGALVAERPTSHRNNLMREMMGSTVANQFRVRHSAGAEAKPPCGRK